MVVCDKCEECAHTSCIKEKGYPQPGTGPWFCIKCRQQLLWYGWDDVTQDVLFLDYIFNKRVPDDLDEADRVRRLAECYRAKGNEL